MSPNLVSAHDASSYHRLIVELSETCGCFYCLKIFSPDKIKDWVDDEQTALCLNCGMDSVIGSGSGFPITEDFLGTMRDFWFN